MTFDESRQVLVSGAIIADTQLPARIGLRADRQDCIIQTMKWWLEHRENNRDCRVGFLLWRFDIGNPRHHHAVTDACLETVFPLVNGRTILAVSRSSSCIPSGPDATH